MEDDVSDIAASINFSNNNSPDFKFQNDTSNEVEKEQTDHGLEHISPELSSNSRDMSALISGKYSSGFGSGTNTGR